MKSSDTDVEVLAVHFQKAIAGRKYILSCTSKRLRYVDVRAIAEELGNEICDALPGLHTFTGCDSTSAFVGKGKKRALSIIKSNKEMCTTFKHFGNSFEVSTETKSSPEKFVCLLYGDKSDGDVNFLLYSLLCAKNMQTQQLSLTRDSLHKHILRANHQTAIWKRVLSENPILPSPSDNGWPLNNWELHLDWMDSPPAALAVLELMSCHCSTNCSAGRCLCLQNQTPCTDACSCSEGCQNKRQQGEQDTETDSESSDNEIYKKK